ncbi:hypothetical protein K450DRAFT_226838 [Umbelopsis ramanniana AG]|uniref:Transmembrane protein n=1 Tax=Umbelopsis ramanniana AG TaxID=1314678 RepID=A0AAD5EFJ2_UMBRA|nr:uncharacterized protein K450DRAFT_226838 [Umbelopsis ramanniana AG]KAI8582773.1 hypothetical protein K450DRAFT_226838 [Umbelopsis ramanniana AG]
MQIYKVTAGLLLPVLIEAQSSTRNATIAHTINSMAAAPTTELGQQIEIVLSITFLVIGVMFSFIKGTYSVLLWMLWPVITICRMLYQVFISGPYRVVAHIMHVLYPVATFCFAAACFGLLIGGFAGIASEAISSFFIAITWGGGGTSKVLSAVADTTPSQPPLVSATTSRSTTPRPVAERLMEFGRRKSKDLLPSALSSSASSIADQGGYFGEWTNHRASFRTRRLSYLDSEDMPDDDDGRSETSWDNDDDDTFTISPAHPTSRLRR